jgi:hypothetical protein
MWLKVRNNQIKLAFQKEMFKLEEKYRIVYANLKLGKFFDMRCIDKCYKTIKKMESKGQAQIFLDEREVIHNF